MKKEESNNEWLHMLYVLIGVTLFSVAYRIFLIPAGLYCGGFTGVAQIIKWVIADACGIPVPTNIDIVGIIAWLMNIPLIFMGLKIVGRKFIIRTIIAVCVQSFLMTVLPSPPKPLFSDALLNCLIGGAISGYGVGLSLREGGSGGGTDVVGMICSKKYPGFSVGKIALFINICVYIFAAVKLDLETAAYSLVFSFIATVVMDKVHDQNIKLTVFIISRNPEIGKKLTDFTGRGVTSWNGWGEFTQHEQLVHMTVINKYEWQYLKRFLLQEDPKVFAFVVSPNMILGNFERRLEVR
ncbi:MAG: YitT family protein [Ruminococcaceae bacterium]|nr:YitT family protein [Oscillospiraceae bacterium]